MSGSDEGEDEYYVELVLNKRFRKGNVEYLVKWEGFGLDDNTWEESKALMQNKKNAEKIIEFETKEKEKTDAQKRSERKRVVERSEGKNEKSSEKQTLERAEKNQKNAEKRSKTVQVATKPVPQAKDGFDRGLKPERIIGATDENGEIMFLIKWMDTEEDELVPAKIANVKCPQLVIGFYEERLDWRPAEDSLINDSVL